MIGTTGERGAALLSVLLLVAVMATVAATALDRIGIATRLAGNSATLVQARAWLGTAELLAMTRIEDLLAADQSQTTLAGGWMGVERSIALPDGALVRARIDDGGNCFNLNSLVEQRSGQLVARPVGGSQFAALMTLVGIAPGEAQRIAAAATDHIDSDSSPTPGGGEDQGALSANRLMADPSELRTVPGVDERHYRLLERWICALPAADLSPINVNTLLPEQSPLLAMLDPVNLNLSRARAQLAGRPAAGYGSVLEFWNSAILKGLPVPPAATAQVRVRSSFFRLRARVAAGGLELAEEALIDARTTPARLVQRRFGGAG